MTFSIQYVCKNVQFAIFMWFCGHTVHTHRFSIKTATVLLFYSELVERMSVLVSIGWSEKGLEQPRPHDTFSAVALALLDIYHSTSCTLV
jgi:hypothetical protein